MVTKVAFLVALLWGSQSLLQKKLMVCTGATPEDFLVLSGACYGLVILLYYIFLYRKNTFLVNTEIKHYWYTLLFTTFFVFLPNMMFLWCLSKAPASRITGTTYLSPIFSFTLGYFFFNENITREQVCGLCLMVVGVLFLNRK